MMRMLALCSALVGAALVSGCVATNVPPPDRRVTIAPDLGTNIYVTDVRCVPGQTGIYTFQANVVNNTRWDLPVQWKVVWLDADGVTIDSAVSTWRDLMLQPYEVGALKGVAPTPNAADMMFYVRHARR